MTSVYSKLSTVLAGYADDSCLAEVVVPSSGSGRKLRRSPLIHRGYYIRHRAMRTVLDWLYDLSEQLNHSPIQVVSLGAGYDTAYFHHTLSGRLSRNVLFIELDYDRVVEEKRRLILRSTKLTSAFDSPVEIDSSNLLSSGNYRLCGVDLADLAALGSVMCRIGVDFGAPTVFVSECSITYMHEHEYSALIGCFCSGLQR